MKSTFQSHARHELLERLERLSPEQRPLWGRMTAPQMVSHLLASMRMALGDLAVASKRLPLRYPPIKQLVIYWLPFPKGAPTAPELVTRVPEEWSADVAALGDAIARLAGRDPGGRWPDHPAFGVMSGRAWGVLTYRHVDHHLRQFGA